MHIESKELAAVNVDGECEYVKESTFEIMPSALNFVIPANSTFYENTGRPVPKRDEKELAVL